MANPDLILVPFAQDGEKNPIPLELSIGDPVYRASWKVGFPPDTRIPKDIGGEPPDGLDINGILNVLSQAIVFVQRGNGYRFDSNLAPYPIGALVRSNDDLTTFQNTAPLNSNNPNSNMTGWRIYNGSGFIVDNLTTNDNAKALSAAQGKVLQDNKLESNKVGASNGVASLDANTKVPVVQLPAATISDAGVLRFATATEVTNRANVSAAITPANVGQTFSGGFSENNWCRLPNGLIMQWGANVPLAANAGATTDVIFPIPFPTACTNTQVSVQDAATEQIGYSNISRSGFTIGKGVSDNAARIANWFAIGY